MSARTLEFRILGGIEVAVDGHQVAIAGTKPRTLLALLLLAEGRRVSAEQLIEELWADEPPQTATAALQVYVAGLRKILPDRLRRASGGYALEVDAAELDATRFVALIAQASSEAAVRPGDAVRRFAEALALWHGEPLSGAAETPSVRAARVRLAEQRLAALEDHASAKSSIGRHEEVVSDLIGLVSAHPTRERLAGQLMLALCRSGRHSESQQVYAALQAALREELGVEPSDEVQALARGIQRRDPTLDAPSLLPIPATRFVGRRQELDSLEKLLGVTRLLTITGAGGSGKTRLALQLVRDVGAAEHPDGVHFVELAGLDDGGSVVGRIANALDVRELPGESLTETVLARLRNLRTLLVLDNCEHLAEQVHALVTVLLARCPGIRIVATSRESLGVEGERLVPIGGLRLPGRNVGVDAALSSDALRLLAARGAAARTGFRIDASNIGAATAICHRLDGLPLAIELAASRLRVLSLREIEQRLDRQLDLLSVSRAAVDRHRTMRAAIDWGYELLEKDERVLFRRLSVFAGGCTLDAAERVGSDPEADPADTVRTVVDTLGRLVDRSMVTPEHVGEATRFRMLEPIRQYAGDRLAESGEQDAARARHVSWYRSLIESAPPFGGGEHAAWMEQIGAELDNFRAALDWALSRDPVADDALAVATPLWWYWWASGQMREGKHWLLRALAVTPPETTPLRAAALRAAAALARNGGDLVEARQLGEQALVVHQELGDPKGLAMAFNNLCMTATGQRDFAAALDYILASRAQAERMEDARGLAVAANNTGTVFRCLGRLADAGAQFATAAEGFRTVGDVRGEAAAIGNLGVVARRSGDLVEARRATLECLRRYRDLDLTEGELDALEGLACLDVIDGRPAPALRLLLLAERERRRLGAPNFVPDESDDRDAAAAAATSALDDSMVAGIAAEVDSLDLCAEVEALLR